MSEPASIDPAPPAPRAAEQLESLVHASPLLEAVHDAVVVTDLDGVVTAWSPGAERTYGYTATEAIGRHVTFLRFPDDVAHHRETVIEPALQCGIIELVVRNRRKDGSEIFSELRVAVLHDDTGTPVQLVGCANDVTARIRAERALRHQQQELEVILDTVPALIWYKDRDNRILRVNRAAAASMGLTKEELKGGSTFDLYPDEAAQYHRDDLEVIRSGRPKLAIVEQVQTGSGEKRWVRTDKVPYQNERGEIVGVIVFAVDITERVLAEQEIQRARDELEVRVSERTTDLVQALDQLRAEIGERQRAEARALQHQTQLAHLMRLFTVEGIAAQLAHEINQPLAAVVNFASGLSTRLRSDQLDVAAMQQAAEHIRQQAMRAAGVIRRLRDFVRNEPPKRVRCSVNQVVRDAVSLIAPEAGEQRVRLTLDLANNAAAIIDRIQIEQVLLNLLRNGLDAVQATKRKAREITISTSVSATARLVEIRVSDTGIGLPARAATHLFEPFFTTKRRGLGMGLAISRSIVEAHGGTIAATKNARHGTTFTFTLPLARARRTRVRKPTVTRAGTKARRR